MLVNHGLHAHAAEGITTLKSRQQTMVVTNQRIVPPSTTESSNSYVNQIVAQAQISAKIQTPRQPTTGWRKPTTYRRFDLKVVPLPFDYKYDLSSSTWRQYGISPIASSVGPGTSLPYYGTTLEGGIRIPDVSQSTINRADTECINKLSASKVNLAVAAAEIGRSLGMITDTALKVALAYRHVRNGNYGAAARALAIKPGKLSSKKVNAAQAWLELQYGWLPLLGDIHGAFEAVIRGIRDMEYTVVARRNISTQLDLPPKPFHYKRWEPQGEVTEGCSTVLWAKISSGILDTLNSLGLLNPALVAWELVPFSFVVDWLFPVGATLNALTGTVGLDFVSGTRTTRVSGRYIVSGCNQQGYWSGSMPSLEIEMNCISRAVLNSFPIHSGVYFKNPFSIKHAANLLALLTSLKR